jgi:hypothetical protein
VFILERVAGQGLVRDELPTLLRREFVQEIRRRPRFECGFRHGLLQEAALSTLTPARLKELYRLVADAFEAELGAEADPELLAFYLYRSDALDRALPLLEVAADRVAARGEQARTLELLDGARRAAVKLKDDSAQDRIEQQIALLGS